MMRKCSRRQTGPVPLRQTPTPPMVIPLRHDPSHRAHRPTHIDVYMQRRGLAPHTDEGRHAFATWAAAGVTHFKGRGVLWEMYNEPNISQFWKPKANVDDYIKLAIETGKAIKHAAPDELFIGPACSTMDFKFL